MTFTTAFKLHVHFTVSTWLRVDSLAANRTIFSKDKTGTPPDLLFRAHIGTDGKLNATLAKPSNVAVRDNKVGTGVIVVKTWTFVAVAISLNTDALTSTVNFKVNNETNDTATFGSGHYFLDSITAYNAYIGSYRTATATWAEGF
jgi:hypothetical protein